MRSQIGEYVIQNWFFGKAAGQFDIDLAESGIQAHLLSDLSLPAEVDLDYGTDRGAPELRKVVADLYGVGPESVIIMGDSGFAAGPAPTTSDFGGDGAARSVSPIAGRAAAASFPAPGSGEGERPPVFDPASTIEATSSAVLGSSAA